MYRYDEFDRRFVQERVAEFSDQVSRRLSGELSEDQFKPLRLMNGVYLQLHAYMLRIAIPYGTLSSRQMRKLAFIARTYDRNFGHFTTRQNLQFNWIALKDVPDILQHLADVEMHCIQTSGNCIRNVTADHFAGAAADEIADPRPYAEILRQWSSLHPEFTYLPRKFKLAVTGAPNDRAAIQVHDIGLEVRRNEAGETGFAVWVGGGQGRTPMVAKKVRDFLPESETARLLHGHPARLQSLRTPRQQVQGAHQDPRARDRHRGIEARHRGRIRGAPRREPDARSAARRDRPDRRLFRAARLRDAARALRCVRAGQGGRTPSSPRFVERNVVAHRQPGYAALTVSLKPIGLVPGDASSEQMDAIADIAERWSFDEIRVSHEQNLVLPHVKLDDLPLVFAELQRAGLGTSNAGLVTDIIACPGLDYCALANARSIPIAQRISERFADPERQREIGDLKLKISGCINACGHHHVGHIGILGVERKGEEFYQITLGGSGDETCSIGEIVGKGFSSAEIVDAVETVVNTYLALRQGPQETFLEAFRRLGEVPFRDALYPAEAA